MKVADQSCGVRRFDSGNSIAEFVEDLTSKMEIHSGEERRAATRQAIAIPIKVTPFVSLGKLSWSSFQALTRDISASGVSILCLERTDAEYLLLEFAQPDLPKGQITLEILRCRPLGPFWEIAGTFVDRQSAS